MDRELDVEDCKKVFEGIVLFEGNSTDCVLRRLISKKALLMVAFKHSYVANLK